MDDQVDLRFRWARMLFDCSSRAEAQIKNLTSNLLLCLTHASTDSSVTFTGLFSVNSIMISKVSPMSVVKPGSLESKR